MYKQYVLLDPDKGCQGQGKQLAFFAGGRRCVERRGREEDSGSVSRTYGRSVEEGLKGRMVGPEMDPQHNSQELESRKAFASVCRTAEYRYVCGNWEGGRKERFGEVAGSSI